MASKHKQDQADDDYFTVVTGLAGFVKDANLVDVIKSDVREVTNRMHEYSIFLNFYFQRKLLTDNATEYFNNLATVPLRHLLFMIQGKTQFSRGDPIFADYMEMKNRHPSIPCNSTSRSAIFQDAIKQFEVALKNNIRVNMRSRLIRYLSNIPKSDGTIMSKLDAKKHVRKLLWEFGRDERLDIDFKLLRTKPYTFIPFLFKIQKELYEHGVRSFSVVPVNSPQSRHVQYADTALKEMLSRHSKLLKVEYKNVYVSFDKLGARLFWEKYFKVTKFENKSKDHRFYNITTNGIQVSIRHKRPPVAVVVKNLEPPTKKRKLNLVPGDEYNLLSYISVLQPEFPRVMGVDTGFRLSIACVTFDTASGERSDYSIMSRKLHADSGLYERKMKLKMWTEEVESVIRVEREELNKIRPLHLDLEAYTDFSLKHLKSRLELYQLDKISRLRFDSFIRRRANIDRIVHELCKDSKIAVFYGNGPNSYNSPIKGYIRTPQQAIYDAFNRHPNATVYKTDEFRTTKACSLCYAIENVPTRTYQGHKNRQKNCCKRCMNRDINAAINMVTRGLHEFFNCPLPQSMSRKQHEGGESDDDDDDDHAGVPIVQQSLDEQQDVEMGSDSDTFRGCESDDDDDDDSDDGIVQQRPTEHVPQQDVEMGSDSDIFRDCESDFDDFQCAEGLADWDMDWIALSDEEVRPSEVQVDPEVYNFSY